MRGLQGWEGGIGIYGKRNKRGMTLGGSINSERLGLFQALGMEFCCSAIHMRRKAHEAFVYAWRDGARYQTCVVVVYGQQMTAIISECSRSYPGCVRCRVLCRCYMLGYNSRSPSCRRVVYRATCAWHV
jgi:hypothetical protein